MSCCKKSHKPVQKVVIPKGMINPGETTIIEIPSNLQKQPIVVAKRKTSLESVNYKKSNVDKTERKDSRHKDRDHSNNSILGNISGARNSKDLEKTEKKERDQFLKDLEEFQKARRKLLNNASFLAGEKQKK